ncbi:MAG: sulfatase [Acidobacteria bacterium]|nr:sulfatase [Acidobacteriota bacterium]
MNSRRDFIKALWAGALAAGAAGRPLFGHGVPARRPNIVFFFPDQVPAHELGAFGGQNIATPNMDRLAAEGTSFSNALSTCPLCAPYRSMLLSGLYPTHSGMLINWLESNPGDPSLAKTLAAAGYFTAYVGKWHLNAGKMKRNGLIMSEEVRELESAGDYSHRPAAETAYVRRHPESEFVPPGPARRGFQHWAAFNFHTEYKHAFYYRDTGERLWMPDYEPQSEVAMAIDFMRQALSVGQPFFIVISPHPPHQPWNAESAPAEFVPRVRRELVRRPNVPANGPPGAGEPRYYYAMLGAVDAAFGKLLAFLDSSGLAQDTLVVVTSDHGEMMGSHGKWEKMAPYEEAVRIPLIFRWPGCVPPRATSDVLFTPMDHHATLSALAAARTPSGMDGRDLSVAVQGAPQGLGREAVLIANYSSHWDYFHSEWPWPEWRGVRTRRYTYVKWFSGKEELFDNAADPYQMENLAASNLAERNRFREILRVLLAEAHDSFMAGPAYAAWYDAERNIVRTGRGLVRQRT